jgi:hypothetical protein
MDVADAAEGKLTVGIVRGGLEAATHDRVALSRQLRPAVEHLQLADRGNDLDVLLGRLAQHASHRLRTAPDRASVRLMIVCHRWHALPRAELGTRQQQFVRQMLRGDQLGGIGDTDAEVFVRQHFEESIFGRHIRRDRPYKLAKLLPRVRGNLRLLCIGKAVRE